MYKKIIIAAILALTLPGAALATEYTGEASVAPFGLFGTIHSAADTTLTLNFNGGYVTGTVVLSQTIADSSTTTPSLGSGTMSDGTTLTVIISTTSTLGYTWTGSIAYSDSEVVGFIGMDAVAAAATIPDFSVSVSYIENKATGLMLAKVVWESDNAGDTTGTVSLPVGLLRSARFYNTIAADENYDFTLKDANGFDILIAGGANLTSVSTTTINPVLNSTYPVAVYGNYQLLGTNTGDDRSGRIELLVGN